LLSSKGDLFGPSLMEARTALFSGLGVSKSAVHCPCCDQHVQQYRRRLYKGLAEMLVWMCRTYSPETGWIDVPRQAPPGMVRGGDYAKLEWWGLIKHKVHDNDPARKDSGLWIPSELGLEFCFHTWRRIQSHVLIYNNELRGFAGEPINIIEALGGDGFHYQRLMAGEW